MDVPRLRASRSSAESTLTYIGNRNDQLITVAGRFGIDGIVEIACIGPVNGDQRQVAPVFAPVDMSGVDLAAECGRGLFHLGREFVRKLMVVDGHLGGHAGFIGMAEHGNNLAQRRAIQCWWVRNARNDDLARRCACAGGGWNQHVMHQSRIIRHYACDAGLADESPDNLLMRALDHFDNQAFLASAPIDIRDRGQHAIAVKHLSHLTRRQKQIFTAGIRNHETETVGVRADTSEHQIHLIDQPIGCASIAHDRAFANEIEQNRLDPLIGFGMIQPQPVRKLAARDRPADLAQQIEDGF